MQPNFSAQTLAHLQSLCAKFAQAKPKARDQISRAYDLVVTGSVRPDPFFDDSVLAMSSKGDVEYQVGPGFCECAAYENEMLCLHRIARRLFLVAIEKEAEVSAPPKKRQPSLKTQLRRHTKALHKENAKRATRLPIAPVIPIRGAKSG